MSEPWKYAGAGGLAGAALALAVVFGAQSIGVLPGANDKHIHDYLMTHPDVVVATIEKAQARESADADQTRQAAVDKIGLKAFFDPSVAYVTGPADAKNTVVEFFDYNCPHCRRTLPALRAFYDAHKKDTRFAFIDYPIFGEDSTTAARVAVAARQQGDRYLALHFALMGEGDTAINHQILVTDMTKVGIDLNKLTATLKDPAVDKTLAAADRLGREAHIDGTPMFIVNGKVHEGEASEAELNALVR